MEVSGDLTNPSGGRKPNSRIRNDSPGHAATSSAAKVLHVVC